MSISERLNESDVQRVIKALNINTNGLNENGWTTISSPIRDDDKKPSFGLNAHTGAWQDHGTGDRGDIVELVKNMMGVDFREAKAWIAEVTGNPLDNESDISNIRKKKSKTVEATYDYTDEKDQLLYQVVRYEPKSFRQRRKNGNGGWIWGLGNNTPRVLYRLPSVLNAIHNGKTICIVEGEKDVHTLEKLGLTATTNAMGANKWRHEYTQALKNALVLLIPDNDKPGLENMHTIAKELVGVVQKVKLIELTNLDAKEDITDWLCKGNSLDDLIQVIKETPVYEEKTVQDEVEHLIKDDLDIDTAPKIPEHVYQNLPDMLKTQCGLIEERHRKDVFLLSALPVIASQMPNVLAGHKDGYYTPDLFTLIVADPGTGKGVAGKSVKLGSVLHAKLIEESRQKKLDWQLKSDEEKATEVEPNEKSLLIPANSSSRAMYDSLEANGGSGLLFETEIDTMLNATSQDWGDFSDITRRAFHHEELSMNRMGVSYRISNPRLSICLTGTYDQLKKMFDNGENGNFSRYAFYTFSAPRVWQSHRPTDNSQALGNSITEASENLCRMYELLNVRDKVVDEQKCSNPLYVDLTQSQWDKLDSTFEEKMDLITDRELSKYLHASNNRVAIIALRIACIFTVLRTYEQMPGKLRNAKSLAPTEQDITAALGLATTFIEHSIRLYHVLPSSTPPNLKGKRHSQFYAALPDKFETTEAENVAESQGIAKRTAQRWLRSFLTNKTIIKIQRGKYEKAPAL